MHSVFAANVLAYRHKDVLPQAILLSITQEAFARAQLLMKQRRQGLFYESKKIRTNRSDSQALLLAIICNKMIFAYIYFILSTLRTILAGKNYWVIFWQLSMREGEAETKFGKTDTPPKRKIKAGTLSPAPLPNTSRYMRAAHCGASNWYDIPLIEMYLSPGTKYYSARYMYLSF